MKSYKEMREYIENIRTRSAWTKGVKEYALELLEELAENYKEERCSDVYVVRALMLNGASDWMQYSEGGCSLIFDEDIAKRLCTPYELQKTCNGLKNPNACETWLAVQARALYQASEMVIEAIFC